jgi:hypothetical protein
MRSTYISRSLEAYCEQINVCAEIALACMEFDRHKRPNIADIIRQLNDTENVIDEVIQGHYCHIYMFCQQSTNHTFICNRRCRAGLFEL